MAPGDKTIGVRPSGEAVRATKCLKTRFNFTNANALFGFITQRAV
jgi:hypothetical protein